MNNPFTGLSMRKYIPSSSEAETILNYFVCNNFQDFNTWQQIAKTKVDYQYHQNHQHNLFTCTATLKWDERILPTIIQNAEAKNKRDSKKRALKKLIQNIIYQGHIANGFKQLNFVQKLPKRRKSSSDQSEQQCQDIKLSHKMMLRNLLQENKILQALNVLKELEIERKDCQIIQCWTYALRYRDKVFLKQILEIIQNKELIQIDIMKKQKDKQQVCLYLPSQNNKQFFSGHQVKTLLQEDLTDFIRYFQIQKPLTQQKVIRSAYLNVRMIPSEKALTMSKSQSPSKQQLSLNFHPIEGRKLFFIKQNNLKYKHIQEFDLPKFQQQKQQIKIGLLQEMYNLLLFLCQDYIFIEEIIRFLQNIQNIKIPFDSNLKPTLYHKAQKYYLHNKPLLVAQFSYILHNKLKLSHQNMSIQGILTNCKPQEDLFLFIYREDEEIINKKTSKRNYNQFYQMNQISINQLVVLVSKTEQQNIFIGQIKQFVQPQIKVYVPLMKTLVQHESFTMYKLYNTKIYDKSSSAIMKIAKKDIEIIQENTNLIWQPPTYPKISVIAQLIIEWLTIKSNVLIVSMKCDSLNSQLTNLGFKTLRIIPKIQEKALGKANIFVAAPNTVCCDLLKNFVFDRVLIQNAHEISEILSILSIVKGCKKLYLLGDPFLPRMEVNNAYCKQKGMGISLFQRLYNEGKITETFTSNIQCKYLYKNVMQWANIYLYNSKLLLHGQQKKTPLIKGFPWPSTQNRICLIHHQYHSNQWIYLNQQAYICSAICAQVIKSGYTNLQQITCSVIQAKDSSYLSKSMMKLLKEMNITDLKMFAKKLELLCNLISSSTNMHSQLSILMLGLNVKQVSFRQLLAALSYGRRGMILICDINIFSDNPDCSNLINWCISHKLLCKIYPQFINKT